MKTNQTQPQLRDKINPESPERRFFRTESRAMRGEDQSMVITGDGAIFNSYTNMGWYAEVILPGFFDEIKMDRCACLFNHDANIVLGRIKNDTLAIKTTDTALQYQSVLPKSREDVYELVEAGYVYESSFAFVAAESRWTEVDKTLLQGKMSDADLNQLSYGGKITVRELVKGRELFDVSPVTYAQYEGTTTEAAKRSYEAWKGVENLQEEKDSEGWADFWEAAKQFYQ